MAKKVINNTGNFWSNEDVRTLKTIFRNSSNIQVASALGRSVKSVERKASRLSLTKTKKYLRTLGR